MSAPVGMGIPAIMSPFVLMLFTEKLIPGVANIMVREVHKNTIDKANSFFFISQKPPYSLTIIWSLLLILILYSTLQLLFRDQVAWFIPDCIVQIMYPVFPAFRNGERFDDGTQQNT